MSFWESRTFVSLDLTRTFPILKCSGSLSQRHVSTKSPALARESRTRKSPFRRTRVSDTWTEGQREAAVSELVTGEFTN